MKNFMLLFVSTLTFLGCTNETSTEKKIIANSSVQFEIDGMVCPNGCAKPIESALFEMDGVASSKVDFSTKVATVTFNDKLVNKTDFVTAIEKLNNNQYKVKELKSETIVTGDENAENTNKEKGVGNVTTTVNTFELPNIIDYLKNIL